MNKSVYFSILLFFISVLGMDSMATTSCVGMENGHIVSSTPSDDFIFHDNGTVSHRKTGLMWQICTMGQTWQGGGCTGTPDFFTWDEALSAASTLNNAGFAGYANWRIPNIKELKSIVERRCYDPAINAAIFPDITSEWFWSASPYAENALLGWGMDFYDGTVDAYTKSNRYYILRLVRDTSN